MPHEGPHDEGWIVLRIDALAFAIDPHHREVMVRLDLPSEEMGLAPGPPAAIRLAPAEARVIAEILVRKAEQAERTNGE